MLKFDWNVSCTHSQSHSIPSNPPVCVEKVPLHQIAKLPAFSLQLEKGIIFTEKDFMFTLCNNLTMFWSGVPLTGVPEKMCTWSCEATLWKCWISNGMDIIHAQLTSSDIVICLPKRKTSLAPGRSGLPQVDLTTFLAACNKFDWDFDYLSLWRHPSHLVWYCAGDQSN